MADKEDFEGAAIRVASDQAKFKIMEAAEELGITDRTEAVRLVVLLRDKGDVSWDGKSDTAELIGDGLIAFNSFRADRKAHGPDL